VHKALCNVIARTDTNPIAIQAKKNLYEETCLEAFVIGLKGSAVRGRIPRTLLGAYEIAIKERNIFYRSKEVPINNNFNTAGDLTGRSLVSIGTESIIWRI